MNSLESHRPERNRIYPDQELKQMIFRAYTAGKQLDHYDEKIAELRELRKKRIEGLTHTEQKRYLELDTMMTDAEVLVPGIVEYKKVLELMNFKKDYIDHLLNHENAHANVSEQLPSQIFKGFRIRFHQDEEGTVVMSPSAKIDTDLSYPEKQYLEENIKVNEAPIHYGDSLSSGDKVNIANNQKRLNEIT